MDCGDMEGWLRSLMAGGERETAYLGGGQFCAVKMFLKRFFGILLVLVNVVKRGVGLCMCIQEGFGI